MNRAGKDIKYQTFIPDVYSGSFEADEADADANAAPLRKPPKKRADRDKGALFHEYDLRTHQFVAHIRRIHPLNRDIEMVVEPKGKIFVQAANPLAAHGKPLYYTHSKTDMYNNKFFMLWDGVMATTFASMCPWFTIGSKKALDKLFELEFET